MTIATDQAPRSAPPLRLLVERRFPLEMNVTLPQIRELLKNTQATLIATLVKAAKDGDIPDDKLKKIIAHMEAQDKQRLQAQRSADWLSGAEMSKDEPLDPSSK